MSGVQSAPLSAPVESAPLSAPVYAPVRAAKGNVATLSQPHVIVGVPARAPAEPVRAARAPVNAPNLAAARSVIAQQPTQAAPVVKPPVTTVAKAEPAKPVVVAEAPVSKPVQVASREQTNTKSDAAPTSTAVASEDGSPEFRWPVRGRIIQGFKTGKSEGISIAVPEGTARMRIVPMAHHEQKHLDKLVKALDGYESNGESFGVADGDEVWLMEMVSKGKAARGSVWVASRVPEGFVGSTANQARTTTFDHNDPANVLFSADVVSFAKQIGLYPKDGTDEAFNFREA